MIRYIIAATMIIVTAMGCSRNTDPHDGHDHSDKLQLTSYTRDFEVFVEATPMVVGESGEILAHFTRLPEFKPLESGKVTATLIVGNDGARQTLDAPVRPGLYKFELTPQKAGDAKLVFDISTPSGAQRIVISGFNVYEDEHEACHSATAAAVRSSNGVNFPKEMSWTVDFATEPVGSRPMGQIIHTMGQILPSEGDLRTVTAKSAGVLTYASGDLTEGKSISAGQVLFRIDGSTMADNNLRVRVLEAKADYEAARREYERKAELQKDRLVTESELNAARNAYESAKAVYDNLSSGFASGGSVAASPIAGAITELLVRNGQYVEAGAPLATVAQNRDLFIKAEIQPSYFRSLSKISGANISCPNSDEVYSLADLGGAIVSYGKSVDNNNPLIPVTLRVNNASGLLPGSFVNLYLIAGDGTDALSVPRTSLIEEMGNYFVYVQLTPEFFEKREVRIGRTDGRYTEILGGLGHNERVVSKGAVLVKLAHGSGALDAHSGHVH